MASSLDCGPVVSLKQLLWRATVCTSLAVYLQGIVALVLLTDGRLSPAILVPVAALVAAQAIVIRRPSGLFIRGRLVRAYSVHLVLAACVVALLALGSPAGERRMVAVIMGTLVVAAPSWQTVAAMRAARRLAPTLASVSNRETLTRCLSFYPMQMLAARLRSAGGSRMRWAAPLLTASATLGVTAAGLAMLFNLFVEKPPGAAIVQASAFVAMWVFYRSLRHSKLHASELRARDARPPILILRQFADDAIGSGWSSASTFEHFFAGELARLGPAISVGRPGERLQPLGAAREYLTGGEWKGAVGTLIDSAGLVVFVLGASDSLVWEFTTSVATRGRERVLIIVPPLPDRTELARRWAHFAAATSDVLRGQLPPALPDAPVLLVFFTGDDAVMMVSGERVARKRWLFARTLPDYRVALRLFESLQAGHLSSARDVEAFAQRFIPIARFTAGADRL